jgi:hypothetical protein
MNNLYDLNFQSTGKFCKICITIKNNIYSKKYSNFKFILKWNKNKWGDMQEQK